MRKMKIDEGNGLFMGVCSGIANSFGIDATLVRIGVAVLTAVFPITAIVYIGLGFILPAR